MDHGYTSVSSRIAGIEGSGDQSVYLHKKGTNRHQNKVFLRVKSDGQNMCKVLATEKSLETSGGLESSFTEE